MGICLHASDADEVNIHIQILTAERFKEVSGGKEQ